MFGCAAFNVAVTEPVEAEFDSTTPSPLKLSTPVVNPVHWHPLPVEVSTCPELPKLPWHLKPVPASIAPSLLKTPGALRYRFVSLPQ
jgi:hypothetical protein